MSLNSFFPTIISANIQSALEKAQVAVAVANRSYEGEIKRAGDRVRLLNISDPTIASYTKNVTSISPENLTAGASELVVDQAKYFAFEIDDIDLAQAGQDLMTSPLGRAGYKLADTADAYLLALYAQAGNARNTYGSPADVTSLNVDVELLGLAEAMNLAGVPKQGRFVIVAPWVVTKLVLAGIVSLTDNVNVFTNGVIARAYGFDIIESPNVYTSSTTTWAQTCNIAGVRGQSFGYAEQILEVTRYRPESAFSDAVKGLHVYGGKIVRPDMTWAWYADYTAEA